MEKKNYTLPYLSVIEFLHEDIVLLFSTGEDGYDPDGIDDEHPEHDIYG